MALYTAMSLVSHRYTHALIVCSLLLYGLLPGSPLCLPSCLLSSQIIGIHDFISCILLLLRVWIRMCACLCMYRLGVYM